MVNHDLAALHVRVFDALAYSSSGPRCVDSLARTKREPPAPTRFAPELIGTGRSAVGPELVTRAIRDQLGDVVAGHLSG